MRSELRALRVRDQRATRAKSDSRRVGPTTPSRSLTATLHSGPKLGPLLAPLHNAGRHGSSPCPPNEAPSSSSRVTLPVLQVGLSTNGRLSKLPATQLQITKQRPSKPAWICQDGMKDAITVVYRFIRNPSNFRQSCRFTVEGWDHAVYLEGYLPCAQRNVSASWSSSRARRVEMRRKPRPQWDSAPSTPFASLTGKGNINLHELAFKQTLEVGTSIKSRVRLCQVTGSHPDKGTYFALKIVNKREALQMKQVQHVHAEKKIATFLNCPFIAKMPYYFQDESFLYLIQEFVPGGDMFTQLQSAGRFPNDVAKFYIAEMISAVNYLHQRDIIYRDIKPENILLDSNGHMKLTNFGFSKKVPERTFTLCGTPEYLAPEVIQSKGHGKGVDWWGVGVLLFEYASGYPPFSHVRPFDLYENIVAGRFGFPKWVDSTAQDLIKGLLTPDPQKRLGCLENGVADVTGHPYFKGADWDKLWNQEYPAPISIKLRGPGDTSYFQSLPEEREEKPPALTAAQQAEFEDF